MVLTSPAGQTSPVKAAAMNVAAPRAVLGRLGQGGAPGPRARRPDGTLTRAREGGQGLAGLQDGEGRGLVHPSGSTWRLKCSVFPLTRGQDPADAAALSRRLFRGEGSGERLTVGGAGPADTPGWHGGAPSLRRRHRGASGGRGGGTAGGICRNRKVPTVCPLTQHGHSWSWGLRFLSRPLKEQSEPEEGASSSLQVSARACPPRRGRLRSHIPADAAGGSPASGPRSQAGRVPGRVSLRIGGGGAPPSCVAGA